LAGTGCQRQLRARKWVVCQLLGGWLKGGEEKKWGGVRFKERLGGLLDSWGTFEYRGKYVGGRAKGRKAFPMWVEGGPTLAGEGQAGAFSRQKDSKGDKAWEICGEGWRQKEGDTEDFTKRQIFR